LGIIGATTAAIAHPDLAFDRLDSRRFAALRFTSPSARLGLLSPPIS
jgi:hypothetical protein